MGVSDMCPTVDAIRAFLEQLVDPMLAQKPSIGDDPPLSQQQKVAKQVHSVVLLYNYYHRKQNPDLEFVAFGEFCKLIVDLRPALLPYMKFTQKPVDLVDVEQQLSLTEKAIMSSYDVCTLLDASKNVPNIEGWSISKVAVLLVDSKKENCFLLYGSITDGVRSLIEKEVDTSNKISEVTTSNKISEVTSEIKTYKKRRVIKKPSKDGLNVDEDRILQVGYSAVKEAAGVNSIDIMRLESYTVYSHSKEKTASRFYIMKCSQSVNEGLIQVPIKDLIESVRGPLVKRSSSSWKVTPVVEYFHMLPYSEIISEWISRETFSNSLQDSKLAEKQLPKLEVTESHVSSEGMSVGLDNKPCSDTIVALNQKENNGCGTITQCGSVKKDQDMDVDNSSRKRTKLEVTESHVSSKGMSVGLDNKPCSDTIVALNQKENNGCSTITQCGSVKKDQDMDVDNSLVFSSKLKEECQKHIANTLQVNEDQKIENPSVQHHSNQCTRPSEAEKVVSTGMHITEGGIKDQSAFDKICADTTFENKSKEKCTLISDNFNTDLEKGRTFIASKGKMGRSDVCPTVDAVRAFLEHLVDPMLPAKASIRGDPSISQQKKVAKQVHSVVLLYNYYHIKQHPELEFVAFKDFCKLIVDLRPALSVYMKFTQKPDETDLVDVEQQLSLTEKAIMSSCDICTCLDASKNVPNIEGWPVLKVAVLLVDSKKNCCLRFCSITDGVWSVIEKDVDSSSQISEVTNGIKQTNKKRRVIQQPTKDGLNVDDEFLKVGYSAVKEATGVNSIDILLLESYTVYSQSKEKTASHFYIMKCSQSTAEGSIQVPIKDLIESFRGPLLKRSSSSWTITSVVEYFHVLPYSEIISEWISRETFSNSLQDSKLAEKQFPKHEVTESYASTEGMSIDLDNKPGSDTIVALNQKENNGCSTITRCDSVKKDQDMDVDNSSVFPSKNKECQKHIGNTLQVNEDQKIENPLVQHSNEYTRPSKAEKVGSKRKHITQGGIKDQPAFDKMCAGTTFENDSVEKCTLNANNSNTDLEKIRIFIASKGKILSQTALNSLIRKRNALALQQRMIEDEMAVCNMKIQRWLAGEEDDLELKLESIIEGCNGSWLRNQGRMCQYLDDQCLPVKIKRLTEAVLTLQSACQELDGICHENNWILPTYSLSQADGAFQANVRVKGVDFEYSCGGDSCSFPREARDSAAAHMLTKLRSMQKNQPSNFGSCV